MTVSEPAAAAQSSGSRNGNAQERYHVVALGPPMSGKTMYLAALAHELRNNEIAPGLRVAFDDKGNAWLRTLYDEIADTTNTDWPLATEAGTHFREVVFSMRVTRRKQRLFGDDQRLSFPILDFTYIDYSGEWVTDPNRHDLRLFGPFQDRLGQADCIVGIMDGVQVVDLLQGGAGGRKYFDNQIQPMLNTMQRLDSVPVHLLLTKWDYVKKHYELGEVSERLLSSDLELLKRFIEDRSGKKRRTGRRTGGVRLIPVSSVGDGFTEGPPENMVKRPGATAAPENVHVPLAAALVDVSKRALDNSAQPLPNTANGGGNNGLIVHYPAGTIGAAMFAFETGRKILAKTMVPTGRWFSRRAQREYARIQAQSLGAVQTVEGATMYTVRTMSRLVDDFENDPNHTGSVLWRAEDD